MEHLREAAARDPENTLALYGLATALREGGRLDEATEAYRAILAKDSGHVFSWRGLGLLARDRGDRDQALAHFRKAAELAPENTLMLHDLAMGLHESGRLAEAAETYRAVVARDPGHIYSWRGLGMVARDRGDHEEALLHFRKAAELDPENTLTLHDLAMGLLELGRFDEATEAYRAVVAKDAGHVFSWRGLGMAARERGDRAAALEHFRKAAALDPENTLMLHDLAMGLLELGRFDEATEAYRAVVAKDAGHVFSWRGLGMAARERGDRAAALEHFRKAAALDPENTLMLHDLAMGLLELGRVDEATEAYRAVVARDPGHVFGWRGLGMSARERGDHAGALEHFRKAAALDPENTLMLHDLAAGLRELGRLDEAAEFFRAVVTKDPGHVHGWRGLGMVARERGDHAEALSCFRKAAALDPSQIWTIQDVATELQKLGRPDEAEPLLGSLVESHPNSADALLAYALGIRHRATASDHVRTLEKAVELEPRHLQAKLALANEYLGAWRLGDAEALYDAMLAQDATNFWALMGKGQIARRRGDGDVAQKAFENAAAVPGALIWATISLCNELIEVGRFDEARNRLGAAISRHPTEPALLLQLGYTERAAGEYAAASAAFASAAALNPLQPQPEIELAAEDIRLGQAGPAVTRLTNLVSRDPRSGQAWEALANALRQIDDERGAVACRRKAVALDPSNLGAHLQLALGLERLGQPREAQHVLEICDLRFGPLPETQVLRAEILQSRGDYPAAHALLKQAAARFPTHFDLWFHHVSLLIHFGAFDEARRAADAPPHCSRREQVRISMLKGQIAAARWDLDEAYSCFNHAAEFYATDSGIHHTASLTALLRLDLDATQAHLETSVRNDPTHRFLHAGNWKPSQTHIGQLLDEYRIDETALSLLRDCLTKDDPVEALEALVLEVPDYTPAAINFLIALRRRELLDRPGQPSPGDRLIPTRITQYWDDNIPPDVEALCDGWRDMHPGYRYIRFSKADARRYLLEMGPTGVLAAFDRASEAAMKADLFRLAALYHEGGYYIDADDRCLAPIPTIDPGDRSLFVYQEDLGTVANNFIGVVPRHPVIGHALVAAREAIERGDTDMLWLATGPGLMTRCLAAHLAGHRQDRLKTMYVLERHDLFKAVAIHCAAAYKHTPKHWSRTAFKQPRMQSLALIGALLDAKSGAET
ncbi:tetratricopeptide repeat protein [Rhodoblastus sp. 17X3]|uniref:tetratricopeptide repeat protein n=1 Tax=Rhodoblastus sp. 17X3 TaxID=3047026 RepID=UPI0024B8395D|nr:tetratricopeptide repeat protein [Rhodoblastus sp. 17X3]MDI9847777.1 tetratricopeptide repeat protein [Rhodoblastus sp. 17X3]